MINFSYRKVGGLRFVKLGRLTFSWSISAVYRPLATEQQSAITRLNRAAIARERRLAAYYADYIDITPEMIGE